MGPNDAGTESSLHTDHLPAGNHSRLFCNNAKAVVFIDRLEFGSKNRIEAQKWDTFFCRLVDGKTDQAREPGLSGESAADSDLV